MSPRRKRKEKGGLKPIAHRTVTAQSNAAKKEARVPGRSHARGESLLLPSSRDLARAVRLPTEAALLHCPPTKRLRYYVQPQQGKQQEDQQQEKKEAQERSDMEKELSCPADSTATVTCNKTLCSARLRGGNPTSPRSTQSAARIRRNTCLERNSRRTSASVNGEKISRREEAVCISGLPEIECASLNTATGSTVVRCGLPACRPNKPPCCAMAGASAATSGVGADAANSIAVCLVDPSQLNHQDDLLAPATDALSPTKKLLVPAESGKAKFYFRRAEQLPVDQDDGSESDVNDEAVENKALLLSGRSTQSSLLQTHQDPVPPSTPTPRLLLNACCSTGVRTPPAGSPLSMSSQASTNSAFSASPLTSCSSFGPSSLPATPSCWLSDEHSPHQTQKHTNDAASPAGAVAQQEQQQDGSVFLWEVVSSSTPMRTRAAAPSSAVPAERSPADNEELEECASLLSLSFGSSSRPYSCGDLNLPSYRNPIAARNSGKSVAGGTDPLFEPAAAEQATETTAPPVFPFPAGSAKAGRLAVAAVTSEYVDSVWSRREQQPDGPLVQRSEQIVTQEQKQQESSTLVLKSSSDRLFFLREGRSERRRAAFGRPDQCETAPAGAAEGAQNNSNTVERVTTCQDGEGHQAAEECHAACSTLVRNRCRESSPITSTADRTLEGVATAAVSLPLQLPIPARAPRGKAHSGQVNRYQQRAGLLPRQAAPAAGAVAEDSFTAGSAEDSALEQGTVTVTAEEVARDIAETTEKTAEVHTWTGEGGKETKSPLLPALLGRAAGSIKSMRVLGGKKQEGTSRCRLQLPADRSSFGNHGETQQQQAAALSAMERAAARAKLAARAAAACAAVIDAAAAAARNAAAASAANQGSAGTAPGEYTEYPDLQRNIHDDYDLFCSTVPGAEAFLESTARSSSSATSRELGGVNTSQHFWQPLRQVSATETDYLRPQACHGSAEGLVGSPAYWSDMSRNSARRSSSGTATSDSRSSSNSRTSTRCTESQSSRSEVTALGGDAGAFQSRGRGWSDKRGNPLKQCDLQQCEDSHGTPEENNESVDSDRQSQRRPAEGESCKCSKWGDSDVEPPRAGVDETGCQIWANDGLKASRCCFSRSSSIGTDATRYTLERRGSRCTRCWCCCSCSFTKCSSLASSPRLRQEHPQKPQWSCDAVEGSNKAALLSSGAGAQEDYPLSSVPSREGDVSTNLAEQPASLERQRAADADETHVQAEGQESTKSVQENSAEDGGILRRDGSKGGSSGWLSGVECSTVGFSGELLKSALATSEGVTKETLKTIGSTGHPSLQAVPALRNSATEDASSAAAERRVVTTDNSRRHVVLGAGRFGKVVLGHHNHSGLLVAVKIIDKSRVRGVGSEKDEVNFRQEIEMHRRLPAHRNIVTVYDVYEDRKSMYLVMELCDRVSLLDKLAEEGPLHEDLARQIFLQILAAVKHCHDHHVVHRDLKPENVLFARRQQPADDGRQLPYGKPPRPAALYHSCCTCHPVGNKTVSPTCTCMSYCCCCCWMPHGDCSGAKPGFGYATHCRSSSAGYPGRQQISECCCAKREIEQTSCWPWSAAAVGVRCDTAAGRGGTGVTGATEQVSSYVFVDQAHPQNVRRNQQKGAEERGAAASDASDLSQPQRRVIRSSTSQQPNTVQQGAQPQQSESRGLNQPAQDSQLRRESVLKQQRPAARRGSSTPEAAPCDSQVVEEARSTETDAASLRSPGSLRERTSTEDKPTNLLAMAGCCCCRRCCWQEEDAEREMRSGHLLSLHMWRRRDRQEPPTVKLIDFGAACSSARGQLRGTACGTTHYLAPEVLTGNYYDGFASDAWSLGVILFTMLAAAPPFDGLTHSRLTRQIVRGEYRMDGLVWWKVSEDAKNLILRLLDVNPQTRITVNEAARHPWVVRALPSGLPSLFFENAHCLSSLAAAAGEATQPDDGCCLSLFEEDDPLVA